MLQDSTSALFLAVDANEYSVASELIQKGAFVDAVKVMYICLLYVAWADQRYRQCCIRHTEQFLNGTVLYDGRQGEGGRTFAFPRFGELTSA